MQKENKPASSSYQIEFFNNLLRYVDVIVTYGNCIDISRGKG